MKPKKVAVLIPTLNEERTLGPLLKSLNSNSYRDKEIVIIDGGSADNTVRIARKAGATVMMETGEKSKRCPANAWNQGAYKAKANVLCFLDADAIAVNRDFLKNGMEVFDGKTAAAYAGYRTVRDTAVEKIVSDSKGISIHPTFVDRKVFVAVGGYPLIGYGEDTLFAEAVKRYASERGLSEKTVPDSYWTGHAVRSLKELYKQKKWYGRTSVMYIRRLKGRQLLRGLAGVYAMPVYFLSFLTMLLIPLSWVFCITALPFIFIFLATLARNRGWGAGKVFVNLVSGMAMVHGLLVYLTSRNARVGR